MSKGFTLIEALIYIGLLGIMIGGGVVGVYNILEGSGRTREAMYREQDAYFVTRKINSVLSQANSVSVPTLGSSSDELVVTTDEGLVRINLTDEQIWLQRESDPEEPLHDIFIKAENIDFVSSTTLSTITATFILDEHVYSVSHYLP